MSSAYRHIGEHEKEIPESKEKEFTPKQTGEKPGFGKKLRFYVASSGKSVSHRRFFSCSPRSESRIRPCRQSMFSAVCTFSATFLRTEKVACVFCSFAMTSRFFSVRISTAGTVTRTV